MNELPPFPVDDATLDMLMAAIDPRGHGDPDAERSSVGELLEFMSQLGGSDTKAIAEVHDDGSDGGPAIHTMRDPHYHDNDVIAALIAEIRRLRADVEGWPQQIQEFGEGLASDNNYFRLRVDELTEHVDELEAQHRALFELLDEADASRATGPCGWVLTEDIRQVMVQLPVKPTTWDGGESEAVADADGFMMLQVEDDSLVGRPGLRSRIKRISDEIRLFCGEDPDTSGIQIQADSLDEETHRMAARMVPPANIAVRRRYVSDWVIADRLVEVVQVMDPIVVAARAIDARWQLGDPDAGVLWAPLREALAAAERSWAKEATHRYGQPACDCGHVQGCTQEGCPGRDAKRYERVSSHAQAEQRYGHPLQYAFVNGHSNIYVGHTEEMDDQTVRKAAGLQGDFQVSRFNRCPTCEQWSPCDVRKATS